MKDVRKSFKLDLEDEIENFNLDLQDQFKSMTELKPEIQMN